MSEQFRNNTDRGMPLEYPLTAMLDSVVTFYGELREFGEILMNNEGRSIMYNLRRRVNRVERSRRRWNLISSRSPSRSRSRSPLPRRWYRMPSASSHDSGLSGTSSPASTHYSGSPSPSIRVNQIQSDSEGERPPSVSVAAPPPPVPDAGAPPSVSSSPPPPPMSVSLPPQAPDAVAPQPPLPPLPPVDPVAPPPPPPVAVPADAPPPPPVAVPADAPPPPPVVIIQKPVCFICLEPEAIRNITYVNCRHMYCSACVVGLERYGIAHRCHYCRTQGPYITGLVI